MGNDVVEAATPGLSGDSPSPSPSPTETTKGKGLKKWRRIKRDVLKESSPPVVDSGKMLKRGFFTPPDAGRRSHPVSSVGSASAADAALLGLESGSRVSTGPGFAFAAGNSRENSEDRSSSKSSTAASAPKPRMSKNLSGKGMTSSVQQQQQQRLQQGKARVESSKKARGGERVQTEKENSQSSLESDSRSSKFAFVQGASSSASTAAAAASSNGILGNDHGEDSGEDHRTNGRRSSPDDCFCNENAGEDEDVSQGDLAAGLAWEAKEKRSQDHEPEDHDPLVDSLLMLHSVQEALEREVKKFREIGLELASPQGSCSKSSSPPLNFSCADEEICETGSSDQLASKGRSQNGSYSLEGQLLSQNERVNLLESKLEATTAMLKVEESKVIELEAALDSCKAQMGELGCTEDSPQESCRIIEREIECLLKQKIEAEVEYLATVRKRQEVIVATLDQGSLTDEQAQKFPKLEVAEGEIEMQKKRIESADKPDPADILDTDEVLRMQKKVCKIGLCFFIQLILLAVVFGLLILSFSQPHSVNVPT